MKRKITSNSDPRARANIDLSVDALFFIKILITLKVIGITKVSDHALNAKILNFGIIDKLRLIF